LRLSSCAARIRRFWIIRFRSTLKYAVVYYHQILTYSTNLNALAHPIQVCIMNLYLTNGANVRNSNFCNAEGQIIYKSKTPGSILTPKRQTIIGKIIPNQSPEDMTDRFGYLAAIAWRTIGSSLLAYGGSDSSLKDFMPAKGIFAQHRVFTAPGDGRSFQWTLGLWMSMLNLHDDPRTPVARGHRSNTGIFGKPRQARLEIFPGFEHLADIILVTYIFVEKLRKERERTTEGAAA